MQPHPKQEFARRNMTRLNAYLGRTADALSAFVLLLAVMLAGGSGPLTAPAVPATSQPQSDTGIGGGRSVPIVSKQQLLVSEARDEATPSGDDVKAFLPPNALALAAPVAGPDPAPRLLAALPAIAASDFDARAPPAIS